MKKLILYMKADCPYCRNALRWMDGLLEAEPVYRNVPLEIIDEDLYPDVAAQADYYYVPCFFVDGVKEHEGAATEKTVRRVFDLALDTSF